jgi:hypothetical protein
LFVGEEELSEESLKSNFEGAICEWSSAPPAIALVTKTRGALNGFLSAYVETFPVAGRSNHNNASLGGCEKPARATGSAAD